MFNFPQSYTKNGEVTTWPGSSLPWIIQKAKAPLAFQTAQDKWNWSPELESYVANANQLSELESALMANAMQKGLEQIDVLEAGSAQVVGDLFAKTIKDSSMSVLDTAKASLAVKASTAARVPGSITKPRTQKAKGVIALKNASHYIQGKHGVWAPSAQTLLLPYQQPSSFPIFLRPCPVTPRHGFVDSRPVNSFEELLEVWGEARRADPDCEALVMPRLTGACSAVALNTGVTWGLSNDGATGTGKRNHTIPAPVSPKDWNNAIRGWTQLKPSDYGVTDTAYLEIVENHGKSICVQMRGGPAGVAARDYVPSADYKVTDVLKLQGEPDLLAWESAVAALKGSAGACVWAPGLALSSHYAVHAITNKVALYAGSDNPQDKTLQPASGAAAPLTPSDYSSISNMLVAWYDAPISHLAKALSKCHQNNSADSGNTGGSDNSRMIWTQKDALTTSIATLHAMALWGNDPHLNMLRAFSVMALARLFAASCIGEARHHASHGPGRFGAQRAIDWNVILTDEAKSKNSGYEYGSIGRTYVYQGATALSFGKVRMILGKAHIDLNAYGWGGSSTKAGEQMTIKKSEEKMLTGGFSHGGPKWAHAARTGLSFMAAIDAFMGEPSEAHWREVTETMNKAVNCAHNGGVVLDKWVQKEEFDALAVCPGLGFLNNVAASIVLI